MNKQQELASASVEPLFAQMRELGIETTEYEDPRTFFARVRKLTKLHVTSGADLKPCECVF